MRRAAARPVTFSTTLPATWLLLALAACGDGGDAAAPAPAPPAAAAPSPAPAAATASTCSLPNFAASALARVNQYRAAGANCRIADQVLKGGEHGRSIGWLTGGKIMGRILGAKLLGRKRSIVPDL